MRGDGRTGAGAVAVVREGASGVEQQALTLVDTDDCVWRITAPARLHLGFLDLDGALGRRFGSLGLTIDRPVLDLSVAPSTTLDVTGPESARLRRCVEAAAVHLGVSVWGQFKLHTALPPHAGFGSGTQLALAAAAGLTRLNAIPFDARAAAVALDRGNRSGIGLAAFLIGGLVLDGGRGESDEPPPIISRLPFPESWRVILVLDRGGVGVHGAAERVAFASLPHFPAEAAGSLCRLTLMKILPAVATADIAAFGSGVTELQRRIGDYFAPAQDGNHFASAPVAAALEDLAARGAAGVGQSSWGPTGYAFAASEDAARRLLQGLPPSLRRADDLAFVVARGRNRGARISSRSAARRGTAIP